MTGTDDTYNPATAHGAKQQLDALQTTSDRSRSMQAQARTHFAKFATILALVIGAAHTVPVIFNPEVSLTAFLVAMAVYVLAVLVLITWYLRTRLATPAGGNARYLIGLIGTFVLYGAAVFLWPHENWFTAILVGLVIALPLTIAAWWRRS